MQIQNELKQLQTMQKSIAGEVDALNHSLKILQENIKLKNKQLQEVYQKIGLLKKSELIISEHAILRYFEHVLGFDIDKIKDEIVSEDIKKNIEFLGNGTYHTPTHAIKVKDNTVVTVIKKLKD